MNNKSENLKKIDAWWFNNYQEEGEILQPDFFTPISYLGVSASIEDISLPFEIHVTAIDDSNTIMYEEVFKITEELDDETNFIDIAENRFLFKHKVDTLEKNPSYLKVLYSDKNKKYSKTIKCRYSTLTGTTKDFDNKPFPAVVLLYRVGFAWSRHVMGVWSNEKGEFSITVPNGKYNAFFIDDNTYKKTSLECWCWHMIIDRDEEYHFKIGNGEVYSLTAWASNGGLDTMFIFFRPMVLDKDETYDKEIDGKSFTIVDMWYDLQMEDINVSINGFQAKPITLQKIYETGPDGYALPAYILQVERSIPGNILSEKQTLVLEYDTSKRKEKDDSVMLAQSQGTLLVFYNDYYGSYIE